MTTEAGKRENRENTRLKQINSVFSKKFWNKLQFTDEQEIDVKHMDDFKNVNLENKAVKHFRADAKRFDQLVCILCPGY